MSEIEKLKTELGQAQLTIEDFRRLVVQDIAKESRLTTELATANARVEELEGLKLLNFIKGRPTEPGRYILKMEKDETGPWLQLEYFELISDNKSADYIVEYFPINRLIEVDDI